MKELKEFFSSRRMALNVLLFPLIFFPLMMTFSNYAISAQVDSSAYLICTDRLDDDYVNSVVQSLGWGCDIAAEDKASKAIREGAIDAFITVNDKGYLIYYNPRSQTSLMASSTLAESLRALGTAQLTTSLNSNNELLLLTNTTLISLEDSELNASAIISTTFIPMTIVLVCSMAAGIVALSLTVREREQNTFEYLLGTGVSPSAIVVGKFIAAFLESCLAGLAAVISICLYTLFFPENIIPFGAVLVITVLGCIVLGAIFFSSVYFCIGCFSKSQREGQLYISAISIIAMLPAYFLSTSAPGREPSSYGAIPILNITSIIRDALYTHFNTFMLFLTIITTIIIACFMLALSVSAMKSKRMLE